MADIWAENGGVFFGYGWNPLDGGAPVRDELRYVGDRHLVTIGPNGSGKSRRLLLVALAELLGWSIVVIDPKGDLCAMTAEHRKKHGSLIRKINPYNAFDLGDDGHNPIQALAVGDDFPDDAMGLTEAIITIEGKEPHFPQGAQDIVAGLTMFTRLELANGSYGDVRSLLAGTDEELQDLVLSPEFKYNKKTIRSVMAAGIEEGWYDELKSKMARVGSIKPDDRELHSVLSTALVQTRWLDSRPIKRSLAKPAFDFSIMKERPCTCYLILPARRLGTHRSWLRLMIASIVQALMKDTKKAKVPVLLMLDEYYAIAAGGFPIIEQNMAMFRGYGIKLWTVWQDLSQARILYGEQGFETFLANAGVLQSFATQDLTTSEYLSQRTGQTTRQILSVGRSQSINPSAPMGISVQDNQTLAQIPMPLMLPQDIRNLDDGYSVIFSHKLKGVTGSYMPYEHPSTAALLRLDPAA